MLFTTSISIAKTNGICKTYSKSGKIISHVGQLLDYRSSYAMHYVKYFLKWNISRLGNTAKLTLMFYLLFFFFFFQSFHRTVMGLMINSDSIQFLIFVITLRNIYIHTTIFVRLKYFRKSLRVKHPDGKTFNLEVLYRLICLKRSHLDTL